MSDDKLPEVGKTDDLLGLAKIVDSELANKIYEDLAAPTVQEVGGAAADIAHGLRLFTAPFLLMGSWHDRLLRYVANVTNRVPEERRIAAPAMIAGPVLEKLRFLEPEDSLTELYLNLLARAIDKDHINEAHPAFVTLIGQLSPDEALIIYRLRDSSFKAVDTLAWDQANDRFVPPPVIEKIDFPVSELTYPEHLYMYTDHLNSLNVMTWHIVGHQEIIRDDSGMQTAVRRRSTMALTEFGKLFVKACIPDDPSIPKRQTAGGEG